MRPADQRAACGVVLLTLFAACGSSQAEQSPPAEAVASEVPAEAIADDALAGQAEADDIAARVKRIVVEQIGVEEAAVTPEAHLVDDIGIDSLDAVELILAFEEEFAIEIPDQDAERVQTVGDAIDLVRTLSVAQAPSG